MNLDLDWIGSNDRFLPGISVQSQFRVFGISRFMCTIHRNVLGMENLLDPMHQQKQMGVETY